MTMNIPTIPSPESVCGGSEGKTVLVLGTFGARERLKEGKLGSALLF